MSRHLRFLPVVLLLLLLSPASIAHNGEYVPPERTRPPLPIGPRTPEGPRHGPGTNPGPTGRAPGEITGGTVRPGTATPRPGSVPGGTSTPSGVRTARPLDWEEVWELLADGAPRARDPLPGEVAKRLRSGLVAALGDESEELRAWATLALGRGGDADAVLGALTAEPDLRSTFAALGAGLAARRAGAGGAALLDRLRPVLAHPDCPPAVRSVVALAMGFAGRGAAGDLLARYGAEADPEVRTVLLFALGSTGHPGAAEFLVPEIEPPKGETPDDPGRRAALVAALARGPGPKVEAALLARLGDPAPDVAAAAALSLRSRAAHPAVHAALTDLAAHAPAHLRSAALLAVTLAGDPDAARLARAALGESGTALGPIGALCLGLGHSVADGPALLARFEDRNRPVDVRAAAVLGAGLVKCRDAAERIEKALGKIPDARVHGYGLIALALLDPERAVRVAESDLGRFSDPEFRRLAMTALGRAGGERAKTLLGVSLGDSYLVNREAARALFRLDPGRAADLVLARLANPENLAARRFAAIVIGRALESGVPTGFGDVLLSTALCRSSPLTRAFAYLESEYLYLR